VAFNNPESVARNVLTIHESDYPAILASVVSEWAATEDVDLEDFHTRVLTSRPNVLEEHWILPAMTVAVMDLKPTASEQAFQQYKNYYDLEIAITYFFSHVDARTLSLIILRHMQATLQFLGENPGVGLAGRDGVQIETVRMTPSYTATSGNVYRKGLMTLFDFRMLQYGP